MTSHVTNYITGAAPGPRPADIRPALAPISLCWCRTIIGDYSADAQRRAPIRHCWPPEWAIFSPRASCRGHPNPSRRRVTTAFVRGAARSRPAVGFFRHCLPRGRALRLIAPSRARSSCRGRRGSGGRVVLWRRGVAATLGGRTGVRVEPGDPRDRHSRLM